MFWTIVGALLFVFVVLPLLASGILSVIAEIGGDFSAWRDRAIRPRDQLNDETVSRLQ